MMPLRDDPRFGDEWRERSARGHAARMRLHDLDDALQQAAVKKFAPLASWLIAHLPADISAPIAQHLLGHPRRGRPREVERHSLAEIEAARQGDPSALIALVRQHVTRDEIDQVTKFFNTRFAKFNRTGPRGSNPHPAAQEERRVRAYVEHQLFYIRKANGGRLPRGSVDAEVNRIIAELKIDNELPYLVADDACVARIVEAIHRGR